MKNLILALVILLSTGTTVFGSLTSGAWFTDTASGSGFILITGSLDLEVEGGPLSATNLTPGEVYSPMGIFCSQNTGTEELKYRGQFESIHPLSNNLLTYLTMKVERKELWGWATVKEIPGISTNGEEPLIHYFKFPDQDPEVVSQSTVSGTLNPDQRDCYRLSVKLDPATPDEEQGQSIQFVFHIEATQTNNPGWD